MDTSHLPADYPLLPPPSGQTSNFINPVSHASVMIVVCSIALVLMISCGALRIYARLCVAHTFSKDDYAFVAAMACLIGYVSVIFDLAAHEQIGRHEWDVRATTLTPVMIQKMLVLQGGYPPAILFTKLSLFLMYLRLFSPSLRTRYLIYSGMIFVVLFYLACLVAEVINCTPRGGQTWIEALLSKSCEEGLVVGYVMAAVNVVSDFYLLAIPIPVVWNLQMPLRRKVGVCAIFMTGFLACICSAINTYFRVHAALSPDLLWNITPILITSVVEICVGIMVGCMPHLASLLRNQFSSVLSTLSLKNLRMRLVSPWSKRSKSDSSEGFQEFNGVAQGAKQEIYLETGILGSVQGKGRFLSSGVHHETEWVDKQDIRSSRGVPTIRDAWND